LLGLGRGALKIGGGSRKFAVGFLACSLILLQGEPFLEFPLFLGLMFLCHASRAHASRPSPHLTRAIDLMNESGTRVSTSQELVVQSAFRQCHY